MRLPLMFEVHYALDDHRAAQRFVLRRGMRKQRAIRLLVITGLVATYFGLTLARPQMVSDWGFVIGLAIGFAVLAILVVLSRRLCLPAEGAVFLRNYRFEFDDDGIRMTSTDRESFTGWSCIRSWGTMSGHLFLLIDENAAIVIPRRSFGGRNAEEELRELISAKTGMEPEVA